MKTPPNNIFTATVFILLFSSLASAADLPAPWKLLEVGMVSGAYEQAPRSGMILSGQGHGTKHFERFPMIGQIWTGDGEITVQVDPLPKEEAQTLAGVVIRADTGTQSQMVYLAVRGGSDWFTVTHRAVSGTPAANETRFVGSLNAPDWLRLVRQGDYVTAFISKDGETWQEEYRVPVPELPAQIYVGAFVLSRTDGANSRATFRNLKIGAPTFSTPTPR